MLLCRLLIITIMIWMFIKLKMLSVGSFDLCSCLNFVFKSCTVHVGCCDSERSTISKYDAYAALFVYDTQTRFWNSHWVELEIEGQSRKFVLGMYWEVAGSALPGFVLQSWKTCAAKLWSGFIYFFCYKISKIWDRILMRHSNSNLISHLALSCRLLLEMYPRT